MDERKDAAFISLEKFETFAAEYFAYRCSAPRDAQGPGPAGGARGGLSWGERTGFFKARTSLDGLRNILTYPMLAI